MRYYVAKGPIDELGYKWDISFYKMSLINGTDIIRIEGDIITTDRITFLNPAYVKRYCKEITKEEYDQILGL